MTGRNKIDDRPVSAMRNLGPSCEKDLNAAGIMTAGDVIRLGAEETFLRMLLARKKQGRSTGACNAAYLYAIYAAIHDIDWRDVPENKKSEFKALTAEMRESGRFK